MPEAVVMNRDQIFESIRDVLEEALGADADDITPDASLTGDLEAESIDFLDIVFRLEKAFDIKIPRDDLFPEDILTSAEYVQDGVVTPEGVQKLKARMPFADLSKFEANPAVQEFATQLTVQDMVRYVESKLAVKG